MKVGDTIETLYGRGKLVSFKEVTNVYELDLPYGKLYANKETVQGGPRNHLAAKKKSVMEINDAYEALEKMRRLNLEVTCQEHGIANVDFDKCVTCLMSGAGDEDSSKKARFSRIRKFVDDTKKLKFRKAGSPCLICGSPVCSNHASSTFRAEKINVCLDCEQLFNFEYIVDCLIMEKRERQKRVDHMLDLYDRTALLLKYSSQYIDGVVDSLETTKTRQNKIGVGGSTAGMVSGALGIAAAATILTPAGPPLLIASLLFGGSATAVQTGTEVKNRYFSEPHQLAGNVIALHGMLKNIIKVADILRDAVARDKIMTDYLNEKPEDAALPDKMVKAYKNNRGGVLAGLTASRLGAAGMEVGQMATAAEASAVGARNARFFSRTSSNLLRTARFARFAGGAFSAATLLLEAKCMNDTIRAIKAGNPCEKASTLRKIKEEIPDLPRTVDLDRECESYLEAMSRRDRNLTEQEAVRLLIETSQAQAEKDLLEKEAEATDELIVDGEEMSSTSGSASTQWGRPVSSEQTIASNGSKSMSGSLLHRIKKFKDEEAAADAEPISIDEAPADLLG